MATRIETLGWGRRAPRTAWLVVFAMVMVAAALAIGTLIRSDGATSTPARSTDGAVSHRRAGDTGPGFDQGGPAAEAALADPGG
jgi:hypothetical protein